MSLLAEEVVQEWLNRSGYFTIRGAKLGYHEFDILAIRPLPDGNHDCRHVEVTVSINPISYITKVPVAIRKESGVARQNARRRDVEQLALGVREWIAAKFDLPRKVELKKSLCPGSWTRELMVGTVKYEEELELLREYGVVVHRMTEVLRALEEERTVIEAAAGRHLVDLMLLRK